MVKKSKKKKRPADLNLLAVSIVEDATNDQPMVDTNGKNPHAVALGRLGGLKGGKRRKEVLSKERRSEIAREAAAARWSKK
jgi:hypothetical protein